MNVTSVPMRSAAGACLALGAALACCVARSPAAAPPAGNPHWNAARCSTCHPADSPPAKPDRAAVERLCLRCHDGRAASAEPHPIGRPIDDKHRLPAGWPLTAGRLGCLTCHDVTPACAAGATRTDDNRKLLRAGSAAPPIPEVTPVQRLLKPTFCQNCHAPEDAAKFNPHAMLTPAREVIADRCLACHTEVLDRAARERTGRAALRGPGETGLCRACHAPHKDSFNPGHLGAKVKPDMLAYMRAREVVGMVKPPGPELVAQAKADKLKPALIPLATDGGIACTTCHNPHQLGTFPAGTPLAYRPMRVVGGRALSPARGGQLCEHCHEL